MNANAEEQESEAAHADGVLGWLGDLADEACQVVRERVDGAVKDAAQVADEEFTRLEARLQRAAILAGALAGGAALIVTGLAGVLGELVGRPWVGQLAAGVGAVAIVTAWLVWSARLQRRRAAARTAERAASRSGARPALSPILAACAAGWAAGQFLARRRR